MAAKKSIVALNVGSQRVTMGVFAPGSKGSLLLRRCESSELLADPATDATRAAQIRAAVDEVATRLKLKGSPVRYAVPGRSVIMRFVKLPPLGGDQVDQIIEFEAQQAVPFPINETVWDYQLIGEDVGSGEAEVLIVASKADTLDELNDAIETSLKAEGVDAAPTALINAYRYNYPDVAEPALLIDLGARSTNLIYIDGDRVFARNSTAVGGATISQAIAKEFEAEFGLADERKLHDGFVSLGSGYEDHPDAEVDAISKVIRNTLTRLQAEIVRTTNQYRSQQGGNAPQRVFLAGGTAGLGYIKEFFEEKLKLPVEFFNPLRNVGVDEKSIDRNALGAEAHRLGEIVGLAAGAIGAAPMKIDLVPSSVARARDLASRKPFLFLAAAVAFSTLLAGIVYYKMAKATTDGKLAELNSEKNELSRWDGQIRGVEKEIADDQARAAALEKAVLDRSYWLELINDMNSRLPNDLVWLTKIEPMSGGQTLSGDPVTGPDGSPVMPDRGAKKDVGTPGKQVIDGLHVLGLWHDEGAGSAAASEYLDALAESGYFEITNLDTERQKYMPRLDGGQAKNRWAYPFEMVLPLKRKIEVSTATK